MYVRICNMKLTVKQVEFSHHLTRAREACRSLVLSYIWAVCKTVLSSRIHLGSFPLCFPQS